MTGTIFDIKEFAVHDGPGPRVTVFLKGCPLRCKWCHNPEGLSSEVQLLWKKEKCTGCGLCHQDIEHELCKELGRCWHHCASGALVVSGQTWESDVLAERLLSYAPILNDCGGGITFSGGEPLFQPEFILEVLGRLTCVHRAIETSGYAAENIFLRMLDVVDFVIMDIKLADPEKHKIYTGVRNDRILKNFAHLKTSGKPHLIRVPLIPQITDTKENLMAISQIVGDSLVELLEYNRLAPAKYAMLQKEFPLGDTAQPNKVDLSIFQNAKLLKL